MSNCLYVILFIFLSWTYNGIAESVPKTRIPRPANDSTPSANPVDPVQSRIEADKVEAPISAGVQNASEGIGQAARAQNGGTDAATVEALNRATQQATDLGSIPDQLLAAGKITGEDWLRLKAQAKKSFDKGVTRGTRGDTQIDTQIVDSPGAPADVRGPAFGFSSPADASPSFGQQGAQSPAYSNQGVRQGEVVGPADMAQAAPGDPTQPGSQSAFGAPWVGTNAAPSNENDLQSFKTDRGAADGDGDIDSGPPGMVGAPTAFGGQSETPMTADQKLGALMLALSEKNKATAKSLEKNPNNKTKNAKNANVQGDFGAPNAPQLPSPIALRTGKAATSAADAKAPSSLIGEFFNWVTGNTPEKSTALDAKTERELASLRGNVRQLQSEKTTLWQAVAFLLAFATSLCAGAIYLRSRKHRNKKRP